MRRALLPASVLALALTGCGYVGEPKPPSLKRPEKVTDLSAAERGSKIQIAFTLPDETTEGLPIAQAPTVELRIGVAPDPWNLANWEQNSTPVPVPAGPWPGTTERAPAGKKMKTTAQGKAARAEKQAIAATRAAERADLARNVAVDAARFAGKTVAIGVLVKGASGHDDGWSRIVTLEVLPVLAAPGGLTAADAQDAVDLKWTGDAPEYRVFRKLPGDTDWTQIGESKQASFEDKTFDYGKTWQYYVQAVRQAGGNVEESAPSKTIAFTPKDVFPPAVPTGLAAIPGTKTVELVWDRVGDADLAGYRVYRDGKRIADGLLTPAYSDRDVVAGTTYQYQVSAVDRAGNESAKCAAVPVRME